VGEKKKMAQNPKEPTPTQQTRLYIHEESTLNAISVGTVFILLGVVYVLALPTSLWDRTVTFFGSFTTRLFPGTSIYVPMPINPSAHAVLYTAVFQFCLGVGLLQILVLALRFIWHSPARRVAESTGNLVFWLGTSFAVLGFLNSSTNVSMWFAFWGALILMAGFSLIVRALVLMLMK
jgi:hypothetical protein